MFLFFLFSRWKHELSEWAVCMYVLLKNCCLQLCRIMCLCAWEHLGRNTICQPSSTCKDLDCQCFFFCFLFFSSFTDAYAAKEPGPGGWDGAGAARWGSGCADKLHRPSHHEHREAHLPHEEAAVAPAERRIQCNRHDLAEKWTVGSLIKLVGFV